MPLAVKRRASAKTTAAKASVANTAVAKNTAANTPAAKSVTNKSKEIAYAREVIKAEVNAVTALLAHMGDEFLKAVDLVDRCTGRVVLCGMGKSGFIAQKLSATLASTGCPSLYVHPSEALHGDLGRLSVGDVVIALSNSGETDEIVRMQSPLKRLGIPVVAITSNATSSLARLADVVLDIGPVKEACPIGLIPTASTTAMLVLGDALAMVIFKRRGLTRADFARFHPGGLIGKRLLRVSEVMRRGPNNPIVRDTQTLLQGLAVMNETPGRPGAATVINKKGKLVGVFTDGDLRRLLEHHRFDGSVLMREVMTKEPKTIRDDAWVEDGERMLRQYHVDNLPVVNEKGDPVGLLDVQDLLVQRSHSS